MREPYDHIIVPGFIRAEAVAAIDADFPPISNHGSFPIGTLKYGPAFAALLDEFAAPETRDGFARKFGVDLSGRPLMTTVRGQCRAKDGRIHTDSTTKIINMAEQVKKAFGIFKGRGVVVPKLRLAQNDPSSLKD